MDQNSFFAIGLVAVMITVIITLTVIVVIQDYKIKDLQKLADIDPLTDVPNRRAFHKLFYSLVEMLPQSHEVGRKPTNLRSLTLFALDMKDFKRVNDTFGHPVGDQLLRDVTKVLQQLLRKGDIFGRIGGDEFLIALPNVDFEEAIMIAERCVSAVEELSLEEAYGGTDISITIGAVSAVGQPRNPSSLIKAADEALYEAKREKVGFIVDRFDLEAN